MSGKLIFDDLKTVGKGKAQKNVLEKTTEYTLIKDGDHFQVELGKAKIRVPFTKASVLAKILTPKHFGHGFANLKLIWEGEELYSEESSFNVDCEDVEKLLKVLEFVV